MLKKLIAILFLNILFVNNANAGYGSGEIKLSENAIYEFHSYIQAIVMMMLFLYLPSLFCLLFLSYILLIH